jgi:hypothetical protein
MNSSTVTPEYTQLLPEPSEPVPTYGMSRIPAVRQRFFLVIPSSFAPAPVTVLARHRIDGVPEGSDR